MFLEIGAEIFYYSILPSFCGERTMAGGEARDQSVALCNILRRWRDKRSVSLWRVYSPVILFIPDVGG
jgi:hypothetical protein